jgi:hypothetical protein
MAYTKTTWRNNQSPAINADNLNHIEEGVYEAHQDIAENTQNIESLTTQTGANTSAIALEKTQRQQADTAETLARENADNLLSARMDTFTQLPSGSTSGDAELIDIRVGADGVTYPTAGDAVRGQVSNLKSKINYLQDNEAFTTYLRTLFSLKIWYLGAFRDNSTRLSTTAPMSFPYDITVNNPFENACTVLIWSSTTPSDESLVSSTAYLVADYPEITIPANTLFTLTYSKKNNADFALSDVSSVYAKSSYTKDLEEVYANVDDVKEDSLYFEQTGRERIDLSWESGAYNSSGKYTDANAYRVPTLLKLAAGNYNVHSDVGTYMFCYEDENYTGGRGATFPWGGTGDNILTVDNVRPYIGIYSAKLNGGIPTTTVLSYDTGVLKKINGKIDKASTTDLMGEVLTVDYTGEINLSDALFSGEIQRKFVWESGGINASGKYNSNANKRTKDLIYLADGDYLIKPNGTGAYCVIAFSDDEYSDGRAILWNVTGERHFPVGGGRNYIGLMCMSATPLDDLSIPLVTLSKTNSESISEVLPPVPWYYTEDAYMSSKVASLQAELEAVSNGDAFVFFTDLHIADNACSSFPIIREVLRETSIDKVICGGDIPTAYNEGTTFISPMDDAEDSLKLQARKYGRLVNSYIKPYASYFGVRGNHDFHIQQNASSEMITEPYSWTYNYLIRNAEKDAVLESDNAYYYFDNKAQKLRYIFLNEYELVGDAPGLSQEQYEWLIDTLDVPENWEIVVIGHTPIYSEMTSYESVLAPVWGILTAYQNRQTYSYSGDVSINANFSSANGIIVGYFCGHNHRSEDFFVDNVLTMSFICDARYTTSQITRQYKTTSEASVAVLVIDKDNGTVKEFNYGAGFDRSKTYK